MKDSDFNLPPRKKARIEIIPLIDVIFFLLATFVLFTLSLNRIQSVPLELPVGGDPHPRSDLLTLQVSDHGQVYFNRELIGMSEVPSRLALWSKDLPDPKVQIAGDEKARWDETVKLLDEVRKAHIEKVSMETRTRPTGR